MQPLARLTITSEQYLAAERKAPYKSELVNGHVYAMAGARREHNQITFNIARELGVRLRDRPCTAYVSDLRVKVAATGLYTYPDVVALCGEALFEDSTLDTLLNPQVLIEVLSESTEAYDRGDKFAHYRRLPSLSDYVLIAQDKVRIEHYVRQGQQWVLSEADDRHDTIQIASIGCALVLRDVYDKVDFARADGTETVPRGRAPTADADPRGA
ncbi:MAG: Uma2 family endonuclease [Gammaproteobacteria bacterium]